MTRFAFGLLFVLVTTTTALAADREHEQLMADIRMLHEHTMRLHLMFNGLLEAMETLSANQEALGTAMRRSFADQRLAIDDVGSNSRVLREKLDETNVRIAALSQEIEALRVSIPPPAPVQTTSCRPFGGGPGERGGRSARTCGGRRITAAALRYGVGRLRVRSVDPGGHGFRSLHRHVSALPDDR